MKKLFLSLLLLASVLQAQQMDIPADVNVAGDLTVNGSAVCLDTGDGCPPPTPPQFIQQWFEINFRASELDQVDHIADLYPSLTKSIGTNGDLWSLNFDAAQDECVSGSFTSPTNIQYYMNAYVLVHWYSSTATTGNTNWTFRHYKGQAQGQSWDSTGAVLTFFNGAKPVVNQMSVAQVLVDLYNAEWDPSQFVNFVLCRDGNNAGDTMASDANVPLVTIQIPVALTAAGLERGRTAAHTRDRAAPIIVETGP